jgi:alpha-L-rhamnosidase
MRPLLTLAALSILPVLAAGPVRDLRVSEGFVNPIGFYDATPSFSWKLPEGVRAQNAYRIVAASAADKLPDSADLWDSGKVSSAQSAWLAYAGKPLGSRQAVHWQVRFWDQDGNESSWSEPARFELGLLDADDWQGEWIRMAEKPAAPAPKVVIEKASYIADGQPDKAIDLTKKLRKRLADGQSTFTVNNEFAGGDPLYGTPKSLALVVIRDGKREEASIPENQSYDLLTGKPAGAAEPFVPQHLRREFEVEKPVKQARLHVTALGLYEIRLNGAKVGEDFMAPGWTPYGEKIEALTYDVTRQLKTGSNAIGAMLGEGWYAGRLGWGESKASGRKPQLLLQLELSYEDGSSQTIASDGSWKATHQGPIRFSGIYDGEIYDARMEMPGWDKTGFDDAAWRSVATSKPTADQGLAPKRHHPVRVVKELPTVKVTEPAPGRFVFDLGQNIVGWPRLNIPVRKGQTITMRFAEMLEKDGTLYTKNYRKAKSTGTYTAAKDGNVTWHPVFTFYGFRYVELSGFPEGTKPEPGWVTGAVLHSDFGWTGSFASSHALLNKLQENINWGLRGNFLEVPTDCPQRDERLGWTGDAQVFAPAAIFNAGVHSFLASWLESMRLDQHDDGAIPNVVPNILNDHCGGPGWSDAATVIPWETYIRTGDPNVLVENFDMMKRWVGYYESKAKDGIVDIKAYGDWLQPHPKEGKTKGDTPLNLIGTAYFARSADLTARAARRLGKDAEAERLEALLAKVKSAFTKAFFDDAGKLTTPRETQTGYLLALAFDLLPENLRPQAFSHLVRLVDDAGGHLGTGFLGTPLLAPTLDRFGRADLAYAVLFKETYPSWFFSIHQGATTMWERWNSYSHADGFGDAGMNSFNHYAYGAIGQWMYERIAGLAPDPAQPGYKHFFIQPQPGGPLTQAEAELETPYGIARSAWKLEAGKLHLKATVPPNTTATLRLPEGATILGNGGKPAPRIEDGHALIDLGPGDHAFTIGGR